YLVKQVNVYITLALHDALPIYRRGGGGDQCGQHDRWCGWTVRGDAGDLPELAGWRRPDWGPSATDAVVRSAVLRAAGVSAAQFPGALEAVRAGLHGRRGQYHAGLHPGLAAD